MLVFSSSRIFIKIGIEIIYPQNINAENSNSVPTLSYLIGVMIIVILFYACTVGEWFVNSNNVIQMNNKSIN